MARWPWIALVAAAGCGATLGAGDAPATALHPGDPSAAPGLRALPELPAAAARDGATHQGLLLARETFGHALPDAPADRAYTSLQHWVDTEVASWIEQRRAQIDATRDRFALGGDPGVVARIVRHAVIGMLHEDTALSLGRLPAPSELDDEPDIAAMYRDIVRSQADAFVGAALRELRDCANEAYRGPADMRPWAEFCHARFDHLRAQIKSRSTMKRATASAKP